MKTAKIFSSRISNNLVNLCSSAAISLIQKIFLPQIIQGQNIGIPPYGYFLREGD